MILAFFIVNLGACAWFDVKQREAPQCTQGGLLECVGPTPGSQCNEGRNGTLMHDGSHCVYVTREVSQYIGCRRLDWFGGGPAQQCDEQRCGCGGQVSIMAPDSSRAMLPAGVAMTA